MPKISIIVPVYKVEAYIYRCIESILCQSDPDFELILVDDGSPDRCGEICDAYARKDSRIHVIHQENGGLSAARNAGIDWAFAHSDSQWLTFIDSDDWIHKDYLKILFEAANSCDADIAACTFYRTDGDVPLMEQEWNAVCLSSEQAYAEHYGKCMTACCKICRKHLYDTVRFPVGKLHEDAYVTHLIAFAAQKIAVLETPLYYYYTNPGSITRVQWNPKRMEEIEAHEVRMEFLSSRGYQKAYKRELEVYADTLLEQAELLCQLQKQDKSCRPYLNRMREKLRFVLQQEKLVGPLLYDKGKTWIMLMAYPVAPLRALAYGLKKAKQQIFHE